MSKNVPNRKKKVKIKSSLRASVFWRKKKSENLITFFFGLILFFFFANGSVLVVCQLCEIMGLITKDFKIGAYSLLLGAQH